MRRVVPLLLLSLVSSWAAAAVTLVADGQARAVIVLPEKPLPVETYAAQELAYHVAKASGARLATVNEPNVPAQPSGRVYIGNTAAARDAGLDGAKLAPEVFVLRAKGPALFVVGRDSEGDALNATTWAGTLFGVYELLDDVMGVRWLWPGQLGEVIPQRRTAAIPEMDKQIAPQLVQRQLRSSLGMRSNVPEGYSPAAAAQVRRDEAVFLRRHRMGKSLRMRYGHAFVNWWDRYGTEHPDWFQMIDGRRPEPGPRGEMSMCVSNPGFHQQIIQNWLADRKQKPGENLTINGCENDVYGMCSCPTCLSWDVERPEKAISERYDAKCVSDRYARFWLTLQQLGSQHDPEAIVTGYAYVNYALPPVRTKLNDHVYIGIVPDVFFPRTAAEHQWVRDMWDGWRKTGARIFLRPNYTLEGYCMPYIYMHKFADEFAHDARNGMIATDFDSLTAMWATQGPQDYLFARWQTRLQAPVDEVLAEYYAGFGPASKQVKAYFDTWEKFTTDNRDRFRGVAQATGGNWANFPKMAHEAFTTDAFAEGHRLLAAAQTAAQGDPVATARVAFLQDGLAHAEKCCALAAARAKGRFRELYQASNELREMRQKIETQNVANLNYCVWLETRAWGVTRDLTYKGEPLRAWKEQVAEAKLQPIVIRKGHGFVALLQAGEHFRAHVSEGQIGKYTDPCRWFLNDPDGNVVQDGVLKPGQEAQLDFPAAKAGVYNFVCDPGANSAHVTLLNDHAALMGQTISFIGETSPLHVYVPVGLKSFRIVLETSAPGETATLTVLAPDGKEAASGCTGQKALYTADVQVPAGQDGQVWGVRLSKAPTGVLEDITLKLDDRLPAYWSHTADRLVVPQ
ncbi:DUF4838 domain-containing protein [bacterium]|nr:DUF4838 domain-containing protein [bacterium]